MKLTLLTDFGLDALAADLHSTSVEKGFWPDFDELDFFGVYDRFAAKIALIHSEGTEVLEAMRKDKGGKEITYEFADILIRTLDLYAAMRDRGLTSYSLDRALTEKAEANKARPPMHGHKWG